jgi:hypothetical protein
MPRLMLDGKIPSKEELLTDDLVKQMVDEAKAEAIKTAPTKETIVQALTTDDLKVLEPVKQMVQTAEETGKKAVDKTAILQALTVEDLKDNAIVNKMLEEKLTQAKFTSDMIKAVMGGKAIVTPHEDGKKSNNQQIYDFLTS